MPAGTVYVIGTPIGNLEDITLRALRILKEEVDTVYCEDTRQTRKLLNHYGIDLPVRALHSHSSEGTIREAVAQLKSGKTVAYMTDSGTPAISDPGSKLVSYARAEGIVISPIPGPSALTALVSVTGFPAKEIIFTGFLGKKEGKLKKELQYLKQFEGIIVIYESPYRIKKLLPLIAEIFPDAHLVIGREMTKFFEELIAGSVAEVIENLESLTEKGEFTVAIYNREKGMERGDRE